MNNRMFSVDICLFSSDDVINRLGLDENGNARRFFANRLMDMSDRYVPFADGVLKNSARVVDGGKAIVYDTPYARYHWYGKLMVDPVTDKGAFFSEDFGFWSRPNTPKVLTSRNMQYQGAPRRGARWVERCYYDNKSQLIRETEKFIREKSK